MNKSILTNILCFCILIIGYLLNERGEILFEAGIFGLSGALTNWFAVHMLFEKVPGLYGSGIIPLRFKEFKVGIRSMLMTQFFTEHNIYKFLNADAGIKLNDQQKETAFKGLVSSVMKSPLGGMLGMFGGESALDGVKETFNSEIDEIISKVLSEKKSIEPSQIEKIVDSRLNELTPNKVKKIIEAMIKEHLGWLVVWGGVFGAIIGVIKSLSKEFF